MSPKIVFPTETLIDIFCFLSRASLETRIRLVSRCTNAIVERYFKGQRSRGPLHPIPPFHVKVNFIKGVNLVYVSTYFLNNRINAITVPRLVQLVADMAIESAEISFHDVSDHLDEEPHNPIPDVNQGAKPQISQWFCYEDPADIKMLRWSVGAMFRSARKARVEFISLTQIVHSQQLNDLMVAIFGGPPPLFSNTINASSGRVLKITFLLPCVNELSWADMDALLDERKAISVRLSFSLEESFIYEYMRHILPRYRCALTFKIGGWDPTLDIILEEFLSATSPLGSFTINCESWSHKDPFTLINQTTKETLTLSRLPTSACLMNK